MLPRVPRLNYKRPKSVIDVSRKNSFAHGIVLYLNLGIVKVERSILEEKLKNVINRQNEIEKELRVLILHFVEEFLTK